MGLQTEYANVMETAQKHNVKLNEMRESDGKLFISGSTEYAYDRDRVWEVIRAHPNWRNETTVDIKAQRQDIYGMWTVRAGDTMSKIAQAVYGDPKMSSRIQEANRDLVKDPDKLQAGTQLKLPPKKGGS